MLEILISCFQHFIRCCRLFLQCCQAICRGLVTLDLSMFTLLSASTYVTLFAEPRIACFPINCVHVDARNEQSSRFERAFWTSFLLAACLFTPCAILLVTSHFAWYYMRRLSRSCYSLRHVCWSLSNRDSSRTESRQYCYLVYYHVR